MRGKRRMKIEKNKDNVKGGGEWRKRSKRRKKEKNKQGGKRRK